jgi:ABC-2 type transport system ATP-binding protein
MTAIETSGLTKRFGDLVAVDDLDMTVENGEVFGFLGPNGAGKSTTINMLLGFLDPSDGSGTILGHDIESESLAVRERIGVLPEGFEPYDRLTGREHVSYAGGIKNCDPDVEALLERVGLQREAWDRRAGGYSKGMAQRLALATALVGDPDLLILDEPSSGLDPEGMAEMRDLITAEAESGTTVFFSSHILSEVEAVCDRIAILRGGELAAIGTLDELREGTVTRVPMAVSVDVVPDGIETDLGGVEGVLTAAVEDGTIHVELDEPAAKMRVLRRVDERATVEDIIAEEASLEAMFERYASGDGETAEDPGETTAEPAEVAQ